MLLDELLNLIRQRAGAFLGNDINLTALSHFIDGFLFAEFQSGISDKYEQVFRSEFRKFVVSETGCDDVEWNRIITTTYGDEAWEKFFELWDKFCEKNFPDKSSADK